jgi:tRNA-(ms[2]io[6]A)-hydroxylase
MLELDAGIGLHSKSSPHWLDAALAAPLRLLDDHAQCELKAAANALALIGRQPENEALVRALSGLALEETRHYRRVRRLLLRLGGRPTRPLRSPYLSGLAADRRGGERALLEELAIAALVEARSCERFELLRQGFSDAGAWELADLYAGLIRSERGHAGLFVQLALAAYPPEQVRAELALRCELEARTLEQLPVTPRMHGGHALGQGTPAPCRPAGAG